MRAHAGRENLYTKNAAASETVSVISEPRIAARTLANASIPPPRRVPSSTTVFPRLVTET